MPKSFQELGVSAPVATALAKQGITHPFAIQDLVLPDALGGLDILAESPTGSGKTLAFGLPLVERTSPGSAHPGALVLVPTRELAIQVAADIEPLAASEGPEGRDRLRRRGHRPPDRPGAKGRYPRRHPRTPFRPDRAPRGQARGCPRARPRRGRSDARHGLQAAGRSDPPWRAYEPADHALQRHLRRRGRRARPRLHREPVARSRCPADRGRAGRDRSCVRPRHRREQARPARRAPTRRPRTRTRLRADEAWCGQARAEARAAAPDPGSRDARKPVAEPARTGTRSVRDGPRSRRSSQRTSRLAASTSTTSRM